jgi:flagellin-like hook-associated protein FlgL
VDNVKNGRSLLKVAAGGIDSIVDELRNLKELALNAANDSNTDEDRAIIQKEFDQKMANINAIALKRFGTFALAFWGEMDKDKGLQRDSSTLIVNLSSDTSNGKQDVKVLEFPEPQTMDGYLKTLEEKISLFSSTSFITPKDITTSNSGGNGIALAMSNDYSLAVQSAMDWQRFVNDMVKLHQEGLDLENNSVNKYANVLIGAKIIPWSLETTNTKLINLGMEAPYLSTQTILERCPDAAPDEAERVIKERGSLISRSDKDVQDNADKATSMANNRNDIIRDNEDKIDVEPAQVNS